MEHKIKIENLSQIDQAAKEFIEAIGNNKIFAFYGEMGSGKTTFIKAICQNLGVEEQITSPTFAIINEYTAANNEPIYHFDFYRIKDIEEAYNIGTEDYFYSNNLCFIEWPEKIAELIPEDAATVTIKEKENHIRYVEIKY